MENASKALIIAGAILLSILIIAIGMYIYNSSTTSIYAAGDQIGSQEQEAFNSQFTTFEENQPGSSVKSMISKLISNAQKNGEEATKLPDVIVYATGKDASKAKRVTSNVANPNIKGFNAMRASIQTKHNYYVEIHYSATTALVDAIIIHYEKPASLPSTAANAADEFYSETKEDGIKDGSTFLTTSAGGTGTGTGTGS